MSERVGIFYFDQRSMIDTLALFAAWRKLERAKIVDMWFDNNRQAICFLVESERFELVPEGEVPPIKRLNVEAVS